MSDMSEMRMMMFDAADVAIKSDTDLDGSLVIGVVSVFEVLHPTNGRILMLVSSDADGERLASWQQSGYLQHAAMMAMHGS